MVKVSSRFSYVGGSGISEITGSSESSEPFIFVINIADIVPSETRRIIMIAIRIFEVLEHLLLLSS